MRVISGSAKGHKLKCIQGINTRPTQDRVKESIFNIISDLIYGSTVLDLFSGTGNFGIEALSRGAKFSVMIDNNYSCIDIINENLRHTKLQNSSKVIKGDVLSTIKSLNEKFNLIFMDPPYKQNLIIPVLKTIYENDILADDGIIIVERSNDDIIENNTFNIYREKVYGITTVSFLQKEIKQF